MAMGAKIKKRMDSPMAFGDLLKTIGAVAALTLLIWGGGVAWSKLKTSTEITDATTKEKLRAIEKKHDRDAQAFETEQKVISEKVGNIDKKQAVIENEVRNTNMMLREFVTHHYEETHKGDP